MTLPAHKNVKAQPTRVGGARPSHLVTTSGIGAVVDLPGMSVIVRGTHAWPLERSEIITEPRLLEKVRGPLGASVRELRSAPWDPADADNGMARSGVPVSPFPRWLRCPACYRLGSIDPPGQFELSHRWGRRPDLAKWVHAGCEKQNKVSAKRRACLPARFVVVCDDGHLDDFPFVDFVHRGSEAACTGALLTMQDSASTLGPRVTVRCTQCKESRNIAQASGRNGSANLPRCRGRHPHLQRFEGCLKPVRLMVLGASNLWFSVTASALHLPQGQTLPDLVAAHWAILGAQPDSGLVWLLVNQVPEMRALRAYSEPAIWAAVQEIKQQGGPVAAEAEDDLLQAEWRLLSRPTTEKQDDDFRAEAINPPREFADLLDQVVLVPRLREVQALIGFTRLSAPERRELSPGNLIKLGRGEAQWVPAFQQRGEGVFLELPGERVTRWAAEVRDHPRIDALREAFGRWSANRERPFDPAFPIARYLLLHTLSHLLLRQVALECGYGSSSIRERIYVGTPAEPATGILLSTAASDSEGTLGGLVALGRPKPLGRLLSLAFEDGRRCSSDPLCAENVPQDPSENLNAAACHACLFAAETSCEANNRWLDRAVLVDLPGTDLAFFR